MLPAIDGFLRQRVDEPSTAEEADAALHQLAGLLGPTPVSADLVPAA
jgi:hypothetical protein